MRLAGFSMVAEMERKQTAALNEQSASTKHCSGKQPLSDTFQHTRCRLRSAAELHRGRIEQGETQREAVHPHD